MNRYHINDAGVAALCSATTQCPFGSFAAEHFSSKDEATEAAEDLYEAFDRGYVPSLEEDPYAAKKYEAYLYAIEYSDWQYAQVGKIIEWAAKTELAGEFEIVETTDHSARIRIATAASENTEIEFYAKRNRVNYTEYMDGEETFVSDIVDIDTGYEMKEYLENTLKEVYQDTEWEE